MIEEKDLLYMHQAMALAQLGDGSVNPNPLVGALVVRDDQIIAQGFHARYGDLHAERNAFKDADLRGINCEGATMYVTLEPCCHHGKQPPCTEAVITHKIGRIVVGLLDPNPLVAGKGLKLLESSGVVVEVIDPMSEMAKELRLQNRVFLRYITTRRPWVVAKYAMTLDGKICTRTGDSQWISGPESRSRVHLLRKSLTAILCGIGTVLADDPMLNTRIDGDPSARNPIRIILDRRLRIPLDSQLVQTAGRIPTIVVFATPAMAETGKIMQLQRHSVKCWCCDTLEQLMQKCGEEKIDSILVEGGGTINEAFLRAGLIDEVYAFIAPKLIGGAEAKTPVEGQGFDRLSEALNLNNIKVEMCGPDVLIHGLSQR